MAITKATASAVAPAAKGDLVVGSATNDAAVLGVGSNDTVLTADSSTATGLKWAAPAAATSSWTQLVASNTNLTVGSGSVTFSSLSGYNKLLIMVRYAACNSGSASIRIRFNSDSGNNYSWFVGEVIAASSYATNIVSDDVSINTDSLRWAQFSSNTNSDCAGFLLVDGANSTGTKSYTFTTGCTPGGGSNGKLISGAGYYTGTSVISSVTVFPSAGSWTQGGIYIYGGN